MMIRDTSDDSRDPERYERQNELRVIFTAFGIVGMIVFVAIYWLY
jgi:hypothetical protein